MSSDEANHSSTPGQKSPKSAGHLPTAPSSDTAPFPSAPSDRSAIERPQLLRPVMVEDRLLRRGSRRAFLTGGIATALGYGAWRWLESRSLDNGVPWPMRRVLELSERIARGYFSPDHQIPELSPGSAPPGPRLNGDLGLNHELDPDEWRLHVIGLAEGNGSARFSLSDIKALPKFQKTMRLCCIEGWSILVNWGGTRFVDFAKRFPPRTPSGRPFDPDGRPRDMHDYVAMATPDGEYYVGMDVASVLHPQTLLAYEIDGRPLSVAHGAPLRLVVPTKYGVKNIKRLGSISYTAIRPRDYWAEQGYDWYAGL